MGAGAEVKVESGDEVEDHDGSYACLICTESVRGTAAQSEVSDGVDGREHRAWRAERVR